MSVCWKNPQDTCSSALELSHKSESDAETSELRRKLAGRLRARGAHHAARRGLHRRHPRGARDHARLKASVSDVTAREWVRLCLETLDDVSLSNARAKRVPRSETLSVVLNLSSGETRKAHPVVGGRSRPRRGQDGHRHDEGRRQGALHTGGVASRKSSHKGVFVVFRFGQSNTTARLSRAHRAFPNARAQVYTYLARIGSRNDARENARRFFGEALAAQRQLPAPHLAYLFRENRNEAPPKSLPSGLCPEPK